MKRPNLWWELEDKFVYLLSDVKIKRYVMKIPFIDSPKEAIKFCNDLIEHYNNGGIQFKDIYKETHLYMPKIDDYYKTFSKAILLGCLPALDANHPMSRSYYAVEIVDTTDKITSPVFYVCPGKWFSDSSLPFIFDSEYSKMYVDNKLTHDNDHPIIKNAIANPHVLFFHGCDDGHVGLRFKTFKLAMKYLNSLHYFEEVFKNPNLLYHN